MFKKRLLYMTVCLLFTLALPAGALADTLEDPSASATGSDTTAPSSQESTATESAPDTSTQTTPPPAPPAQGPASPTGADSTTYVQNPETGLWENDFYTWDPVTHQTKPKTSQDYSYNPVTHMWDTTEWVFDAAAGKYVPNVVSTPIAPAAVQQAALTTDPGSTSTTTTNAQNTGVFDLFYDARISNSISSMAASGSAAVTGNTIGGSALTGDATDIANILNMLQSSWGLQPASDLLTFVANINGDVVGDIYIDPSQLGPGSLAVNNSTAQNDLTINSRGSGLIDNDITLGSTSGDATVSNNTNAGNATTGNSTAIANVVNLLNSVIAAQNSFLGVININGNLNGDILLPPNFLDQLIASNAPSATVTLNDTVNNKLEANLNNTQLINNNINLTAASGGALVDSNGTAGSATTGNASTNLTLFNLTGRQLVAKNSLLVFVNVKGQWIGLIMDAPLGSTAAALGGGVLGNRLVDNTVVINEDTNNVINNDITVAAQSGNATVMNNTNAGNATSGNATALANIMNINGSNLSLSDWFGILFINVLGTWNGSFGVNTDAGNLPAVPEVLGNNLVAATTKPARTAVFGFLPGRTTEANPGVFAGADSNVNSSSTNTQNAILASSTTNGSAPKAGSTPNSQGLNVWILPISSFVIIMLVMSALSSSGEFTDKFHSYMLARRLRKS